jgi:hypothetical protein
VETDLPPAAMFPAVSSTERREVLLADGTDVAFDEPFFEETLGADQLLRRTSTRWVSDRDVIRWGASLDQRPRALIFHVGRCGSTLLAHMIDRDPTALVLREPGPLGGVQWTAASVDADGAYFDQLLVGLVALYERFAASRDQHAVLKLSSFAGGDVARLTALLPETPVVLIHRDPVATVASALDGPPLWLLELLSRPARVLSWATAGVELPPTPTLAELFAALWATTVRSILALPPERTLMISYHELVDRPEAVLDALAAHGVVGPRLDRPAALADMGRYSKAPTEAFDPKGTHARTPLSDAVIDQVLTVVGDLPARVAARALA